MKSLLCNRKELWNRHGYESYYMYIDKPNQVTRVPESLKSGVVTPEIILSALVNGFPNPVPLPGA